MPPGPSTSTSVPSFHRVVAFSTPATQGMPYSLATSAPCWSEPPTSKMMPPAFTKSGVHHGIGRSRDEDLSFEQGFFVCGMQYLYAPSDISGRDAGADVFTFLQWRNWRPRDKPARIDDRRRLLYAREPFEENGIPARELFQIYRVIVPTCIKLFDSQIKYLLDRIESFHCHQRLRLREDPSPKFGHYVNEIFFVRFPVTTECFEQ